MNSSVCEVLARITLSKIKHSLSLGLFPSSYVIIWPHFPLPIPAASTSLPFGTCRGFPAFRPLLMLFVLPEMPFLPLPFPPSPISLPALFGSMSPPQEALLQGPLGPR